MCEPGDHRPSTVTISGMARMPAVPAEFPRPPAELVGDRVDAVVDRLGHVPAADVVHPGDESIGDGERLPVQEGRRQVRPVEGVRLRRRPAKVRTTMSETTPPDHGE